MKTLQQIKDQFAKERFHNSWAEMKLHFEPESIEKMLDQISELYAKSARAEAWDAACLAMRIECESRFQYQANQNKVHSTKFPLNPYKS